MKQLNLYYIGGSDQRPEGRTVEPTDDIQIWLKCAGLNKPYTTLTEVLADSSTLEALIADSNAVDYLVRSKSFAKSEALVPVMTSATTPSGVVSGTSDEGGTNALYKAFDGDSSTKGYIADNLSTAYIQYEFPTSKYVTRFMFQVQFGTGRNVTLQLSYSDNGTSFENIAESFTYLASDNGNKKYFNFEPVGSHKYWRITRTCTPATTNFASEIQFYNVEEGLTDNATAMSYIGLNNYASNSLLADSTWCSAICNSAYFESVLNVKVPTMTSATTPSGIAFDNGNYDNNNPAWYSFSDQANKTWVSPNGSGAGKYFGYEFSSAVKIYKAVINSDASYTTGTYAFNSAKIQATNDNDWSNPIDLQSYNNPGETDYSFIFNNPTAYSKYRWICTAYSGGKYYGGMKLQFYGRKDV